MQVGLQVGGIVVYIYRRILIFAASLVFILNLQALSLPSDDYSLNIKKSFKPKKPEYLINKYDSDRYLNHYLKNQINNIKIKNRTYKQYFHDFLHDLIELNKQTISLQTMKVVTATRSVDQDLHSAFYNRNTHTNLSPFSSFTYNFTDKSVPVLIAGLTALSYLGHNKDIQLTSEVFIKGVISIWFIKDLIKYTLKTGACLRPWNQKFDRKKQAYGGFPSGHMSEAFYMSTLYGIRHGARFGIPFALYTGFLFATSVAGNRHYMSQLVGGMGLGFVYTLASLKIINKREAVGNWSIDFGRDKTGDPSLKFSYKF